MKVFIILSILVSGLSTLAECNINVEGPAFVAAMGEAETDMKSMIVECSLDESSNTNENFLAFCDKDDSGKREEFLVQLGPIYEMAQQLNESSTCETVKAKKVEVKKVSQKIKNHYGLL